LTLRDIDNAPKRPRSNHYWDESEKSYLTNLVNTFSQDSTSSIIEWARIHEEFSAKYAWAKDIKKETLKSFFYKRIKIEKLSNNQETAQQDSNNMENQIIGDRNQMMAKVGTEMAANTKIFTQEETDRISVSLNF